MAAVIIFTAACECSLTARFPPTGGVRQERAIRQETEGMSERGNLSEKIDEKEISDLTAQCEAVVSMYCDIYPGEKGADGDGNRKGNPNRYLIDRIEGPAGGTGISRSQYGSGSALLFLENRKRFSSFGNR